MTKYDALIELMREANAERGSNTAVKRCVKAAKVLGLDDGEIVRLMGYLDYCGTDGKPYSDKITRVWQ